LFVTDHHKKWLTQPQSPRLRPTSPDFSADQDIDFVLFPSPTHHRQARGPTERAPATFGVISPAHGSTGHGQLQQHQRRNSTRQTASASPVQNPRVSNIIHDTASCPSSTSLQPSNSPGPRSHFYASSAPSSLVNLEHQNNRRTRPPVPLFSNTTGNMNQQTLSHPSPSFLEGTQCPNIRVTSSLTHADMPSGLFDFPLSFHGITPDTSPMVSFTEIGDLHLGASTKSFAPVNQQTPPSTSSVYTVSPKDLMLDTMSAPPSTTLTNLTTPGTNYMESPYMIDSADTSPLFANDALGVDADCWPSLFDGEPSQEFDESSLDSPTLNMYSAPRMSRYGSSPGQPSSKGSHQGRHSSVSGVSAKRRDKPLPAITIEDPTDIIAVKRARNTMAARKSRQKRVERNEELMTQVSELEKKVDYWKQIALSRGHVES
jgi:general control protein GCN4